MQDNMIVSGVFRLASDPELRSLASGTNLASLRLAWNNSRKNATTGEWEDVGNFISATVWGRQGEAAARNLHKGSRISVIGRLEHRTWQDQNGGKREAHQIVVERLQYLDPKGDGQGGGFSARSEAQTSPAAPPAAPPVTPTHDDDIPF